MTIKSVLIASTSALTIATGALAADAIVAADPEPVQYVRVCDAYGTGYFYIPGSETCLKVGGYVRFQVDAGSNASGSSDWNSFTRANVEFTAKSDTEYGALTSVIVLQTDADNGDGSSTTHLDSAYIDIAGFRAGLFYSWWDDGLSGETDTLASYETLHNSIRYQYQNGDFYAGISVDELEDGASDDSNNVGVAFAVGGKTGAFTYQVIGGYDNDMENGAVRAIGTVGVGPGTLGVAAAWASGNNSYYAESEWTVAAEYAVAATDKLTITPAAQYFAHYGVADNNIDFRDGNAWRVGLTANYQIGENLYAKATVNYTSADDEDDVTTGFLRLQRSF